MRPESFLSNGVGNACVAWTGSIAMPLMRQSIQIMQENMLAIYALLVGCRIAQGELQERTRTRMETLPRAARCHGYECTLGARGLNAFARNTHRYQAA